ncbi:hypothetical protein BDM02DRAFT_1970021 [Thelephora ganbajun]|uniref:Uncharacterized protein n=1 Tax=Thelephora ganbajun TaxID=370292 RepID=A0ACB6ZID0_THEGA|nr:hypothetical protein BDM02DRAFT_1970021 [Thelephora ganbajun]
MLPSHIRQRVINGYQHIMARPFVRVWVVLVIVHFIVQIALQGVTLKDNKQAKNTTSLCLSLVQTPVGLSLLEDDNLSMCNGIPGYNNVTCILISSAREPSPLPSLNDTDAKALMGFDLDLDDIHTIILSGSEHFVTSRCVLSLQWIYDVFRDNVAEDVATICFQFWLLIVSLLAVLQDSIPHLAVCIASHVLDVGWAGFRIKSTITLRQNYYKLVVDGACGGKDLLGNWWDQRLAHAAPLFGTNVITLILLGALSVILFRRYAKINFSRIGVSPPITRMYKIALAFSAFLQLAAFFTIIAAGMWIDRISCGAITSLVGNIRAYQATFFVLAAIIAPWVISGWWAVFREVKWAFVLFAVLHAFLLPLWPTMFASTVYRYIFRTWSFFACVSITSYLFVLATTIMAVICRLHFGRGLGHFW